MTKVYTELSESIQSSEDGKRKRFLNVLDSFISFFIVTPLVVGFW